MNGMLRVWLAGAVGLSLRLAVFAPALFAGAAEPQMPKVERVRPLVPDPIASAPGVFFFEDLETITDLRERFQDQGLDEGRFRISDVDPFSGKKSIQQTYKPLSEFAQGADPGNAGWVWRFFGDNPYGQPEPKGKFTTLVARWYHKFQEGFQPRDGAHFPPKMARLGVFRPGDWSGAYRVYYWIGGDDAHISIERRTRVPDAHREWLPNHYCNWGYADATNVGRWTHHELRVQLGEGKRADRVQAWADGILICDVVGDDLAAGYREYTPNGMALDCYWNGGSPVSQSRFYDDFILSTEFVGPARTPLNPVIVRCPGPQGMKAWEVEVARTVQKPLVSDRTDDGVVIRYQPQQFDRETVWKGSAAGAATEVAVGAEAGAFTGPLAGKEALEPNTFYTVRIRWQAGDGVWSAWSPWHAGFATTWAEGTPPEQRALPAGYLIGQPIK
jgi:hypothetical protein